MQKLWFPVLIFFVLMMSSCSSSKKYRGAQKGARIEKKGIPEIRNDHSSAKLKTKEEYRDAQSEELHQFIDQWKGVPHRMGGNSTRGVDCSGFVIQVYDKVYKDQFVNRRARDLYLETVPVKKEDLQEGDLVFFKIRSRSIDHVGIYLQNGDFVHVSSSRGVMISNLREAYFTKYYFAGGRKKS